MKDRAHIFERITNDVIAAMERDHLAPWHKPWTASGDGELPRNAVSGKTYRGINVLALVAAAWSKGYRSSRWLTFKQAKELGGSVRKGEKSTQVVFWKILERDRANDAGETETHRFPMARTYCVFNVEQCDGLPAKLTAVGEMAKPDAREVNGEAERLLRAAPCPVRHGGDRAYYCPPEDRVQLPERASFDTTAHYYSVAFHELGHATGHTSRLGRKFGEWFGNHEYTREELVAEFTACMLAGHCGFERVTLANSAAYLKSWASKLREEPRLLVDAAQAAQKAADWLLGRADASESDDEAAAAEMAA